MMKRKRNRTVQFAVCLSNEGYPVSLQIGKLYRVIGDEAATAHGYIRIVDESGEDYAYAASRFHLIELPATVGQELLAAAHA
jgi:hypothetical protein